MRATRATLRTAFRTLSGGLLLAVVALAALPSHAQTPRDYAISLPAVRYEAEGEYAIISFNVTNNGGDAPDTTQINIVENDSGRIETSVELPALAAGRSYPFDVRLPLARFADGDIFLRVEAGIDAYEAAGSAIARDNSQLLRIDVSEAPSPFDVEIPLLGIGIRVSEAGIRLNSARLSWPQLALAAFVVLALLILAWCLRLIARLVLRRPPAFEAWQPPYAFNAWHNPDSATARRQGWQMHAASNLIQTPCAPEQAAVVKRLVNGDGSTLAGWTIKAARSQQYDAYGRVNRSQALMSLDVIQGLNRMATRALTLPADELERALQPIAKSISRAALASIEKQNRGLRIALDLRLEGEPGVARILFELYQCQDGAWRLLDQWEPELSISGSLIPEQFTLSLNGMLPGESYAEFKRRLPDEIARLLCSMLQPQRAIGAPAAPADTAQGEAS